MPALSVVVVGAREVAHDFQRAAFTVPRSMGRTTRFYASRLKFAIQAGAPVDTGAYRDAWQVDQLGLNVFAVTNDKPYMNRLEYGFHGIDALGRHYDQPPQPHIRPAEMLILPEFVRAIEADVALALR